ncbi:MAG: glutamate synthase [Lentisphaerae bacterium]|jgi:methylamine---glutamate N-methyltransferase subunit C|nr:glutamate synthase [Lentisphaerota bacterium]MBT4817810.1 glutamate synthase [Lentisphaerota bacterium]MBT5612137.1 glutamate synthase [Lentisphaerota bacterium]MBT7058764.1 glutamate synthase [Lentisphaerota bacterium]
MASYRCGLCSHICDPEREGTAWEDLPADWLCPICGSGKSEFVAVDDAPPAAPVPGEPEAAPAGAYECDLCSHTYDEAPEGTRWDDLPNDWTCPVCGSGKDAFKATAPAAPPAKASPAVTTSNDIPADYLAEWRRSADEVETHMADIHEMAMEGHSIIEPMRTRLPMFSWEEILIKGAQLAKLPLNKSQPVSTRTVIGPGAEKPLVIESPLIITHMSYGALSPEAKIALSKGSAMAETAMSSGEGGILPESLDSAARYIFEYVPNKYSVTDEYLQQVDAIEIKIGQSAKPGMGGHLPGSKVTKEIARIRGFREGVDIISPSHFPDIRGKEDLKTTVDWLREKSGGKPIGVKFAAGDIEGDMDVALHGGVDFITIDGRAGATGAAPKFVKGSASVPTIFALARARGILDERGADDVSLIITGGLRISSDFAKALALGADAVAVGTAAMMALGCQQYRICNTGRCPVGIATQDPALRARLDVEKSAARVGNYLKVSTKELADFARLTGNDDVHGLSVADLCTTNSEIAGHTPVQHV